MTSPQPTVLTVNSENIPQDLKSKNQWIGWIIGKNKPNGRYDKIPVNIRAKPCNALLAINQMDFTTALDRYNNDFFSGVGFVLNGESFKEDEYGQHLYLIGIDIDNCVEINADGDYKISDEVNKILESLNTYFELSPSGTGLRLFAYSKEKLESSSANGYELYLDKRYLTITGQGKGQIIEQTECLNSLHQKLFPNKHAKPKSNIVKGRFQSSKELPQQVENKLRSALNFLSSDCDYNIWIVIVWAIASTGLNSAMEIAREWSMLSTDRYNDEAFEKVWSSYDPDKGITLGTLLYHAEQAGWVYESSSKFKYDDEGDILNGKSYAQKYRDKQIFIYESGAMLCFNEDRGWENAPPYEAEMCAKGIVNDLKSDAAESFKRDPNSGETKRKLKHASISSQEPKIRAMITMAKSEPGMTISQSKFDADSQLIGMQNGIYNLKLGQLLKPSSNILVSMRTAVDHDPEARCPLFMNFLDIVQPNRGVQKLLQQLVGIFLSGETGLQKLVILYGHGANGKSTFIEVIYWLLGDYGHRIPTEILMQHQRNPQGPSPDIVALKGKRMVFCNEVEEGKRLDDARVKEFTGGDSLTGRHMYAKHSITFTPTHKLVMVGNHKPVISDMSHGMWRRILLIAFLITIQTNKQDPQLVNKLKSEGAGIFNWALAGYRDYLQNGLKIPKEVLDDNETYKAEEDVLGEWIADHCDIKAGALALIDQSYKAYRKWSLDHGHYPLSQSKLSRRLGDRGYQRDKGKRKYQGFELNEAGTIAARMAV